MKACEYYSEDEKYHKEIGLKKQEHKKRGTDLIELYGKYENPLIIYFKLLWLNVPNIIDSLIFNKLSK